MVNGRLRLRSRKGGSHPRRVHAVSRAAAPKFSIIFWGAAGVLDWDVDAINGAAVAGLQIDGIGGAAGSFWFCEPGADPFLASIGGYVGDRYNRHRGVIWTQTASM